MSENPSSAMEAASVGTAVDDAALTARFARGDPAVFAQVVAQYQDRVAGLAFRLLGWGHDVEDVVQDVFVAVLQNLSSFRGQSQLATWIYRITVNECRRHRRKRLLRLNFWRRAEHATPHIADAGPDTTVETRQQVRSAVAALAPPQREVVVLRYLEGLDIPEIAQILELSRNAVEVRLSRARDQLRSVLGPLLQD
jgi:RNA polymerase sigma-70 factor, ECF subfamily